VLLQDAWSCMSSTIRARHNMQKWHSLQSNSSVN